MMMTLYVASLDSLSLAGPRTMTTSNSRVLILGLALASWLITRPFSGIWHDSKFYTLQALRHLNPATFSQDLFFLYGSQDQYSLFSNLHAAAISVWGLNPGTMVLQGLGLGLWFLAAWALTRILPCRMAGVALLLIASFGSYGSHGVFSYGESFLTARLYAEAFSLAGLAAWLTGRRAWGGVAFAAACAMHPLMTLPVVMIGLGMLLQPRMWFGLIGAGVLLALALGMMGVTPFTGLTQPMDSVWLELVVARTPHVFLHVWKWEGFSQALFVVVVTGLAWRTLPKGQLGRLAWVTLTCVVGAFSIAYVGGSLLKLPLIAALQLTRVMWIGLVIAIILVVAMLWENRHGNVWNRMLAFGLALGPFLDAGAQGGYALLVLVIFVLGKHQLPDYKPSPWLWLLLGLLPLQIMLWGLLNVRMEAEWEGLLTEQTVWRVYFSGPATALILAASAYWLVDRDSLSRPLKLAGSTVVAGLLGLALFTWYDLKPRLDYDSPQRRAAIAPIADRVPGNAVVYWVEAPAKAWFWLGRANYLSFSQTAGSVFSRATAVEASRRAPFVKPASLHDSSHSWYERPHAQPAQFLSAAVVRQVCRDPILDYVIGLSQPKTGAVYFEDPETGRGYGLYDCRVMRASDATFSATNAVDVQEHVKGRL